MQNIGIATGGMLVRKMCRDGGSSGSWLNNTLPEAVTAYSLVHPWSHVLRIFQGRDFHLTQIPGVGADCGILMCLVLRVLLVSLVLLDGLVLLDPL